jgi:hypothetical protein
MRLLRVEKFKLKSVLMNIFTAKLELVKIGFIFPFADNNWGRTDTTEIPNVGKNHFELKWRDIFIEKTNEVFYITSDLIGHYRGYRCRNLWPFYYLPGYNIFGQGNTLEVAVRDFLINFKNKTYNISN